MAYNSTIDKATDDILIYGNTAKDGTGTSYVPIVDSDGQLQVDVLSSALPTGASTSAKQDTIIGHLDGVEGLLTTIDADTGNISTKIDTIAGAVSGTEMQVDVLTMPTTTVQATNLDIRDIDAATDDITIHGDVGVVDQLDLTNSNPLVTAVVDANGDQITSFGGGTQYTEADTDASITGTAMMMEGAGNALVPAQGTTTDGLLVNLGSNNDVTVTSGTITTITNPVTVTATNLDVQSGGVDLATSAQAAAIQTAVETIDNAISGSEMQVDVVGALPAGTNAIGKLAANSGVDIGDVDVTSVIAGTGATNLGKAEDAGHTTGDTGVYVLGVRNDTPNTALTNTDADYGSFAISKTGATRVAPIEEDFAALGSNHVKKYYTNAGAVTDGIVWSPAAGKRWYITSIFINVSAAATVTLEDDKAGGDEAIWKAELAANSGWSSSFPVPWFSGEDAADLIVTTTAGNVYITVVGYEI